LKVKPDYTTVVDSDRRYVEVSDSFCKLVGYNREDLIGRRYDDLSAPNTNDIAVIFDLFVRLRYMHGLWMLVSRNGARILVRYESWLRPDSLIQGNMEVIGAGY
jgi:PAS domain S-box-containing protein